MAALTAQDPDDEAAALHAELARRERTHERLLRDLVQRTRGEEPLPGAAGGPYRLLLDVERARAALEAEVGGLRAEVQEHRAGREAAEAEVLALRARVLELGDELAATVTSLGAYADWAHELRDQRPAGGRSRPARIARRVARAARSRLPG